MDVVVVVAGDDGIVAVVELVASTVGFAEHVVRYDRHVVVVCIVVVPIENVSGIDAGAPFGSRVVVVVGSAVGGSWEQ